MPWHIESDNSECNGYAVVKDSDGSVSGCHETMEEAEAQLAALYASEGKARMIFPAKVITRNQDTVLPVDGAYVFSAEVSSTRTDAYFTHMTEKTLHNFVEDAKAGVQFLDSHNSWLLGYGRSFDARYEPDRAIVDFYTVPNIRLNGLTYQSTDDFIRAVQAGLVNDVSVGFYGGEWLCDICGRAMSSYGFFGMWPACDHFPGEKYVTKDDVVKLSTYSIDNAHLSEVSGVYDGATPMAQIIARSKQQLFRKFPVRSKKMDEFEKFLKENDLTLEQIRAIMVENKELKARSEEAELYRQELIEDALRMGIRAVGEKFPIDHYRKLFEGATLQLIKTMRDTWATQNPFEPGRKTTDETKPIVKPAKLVPDSAYKS